MSDRYDVVRLEIAKLELKPGDTLVVRGDFQTSDEFARMVERVRAIIPSGVSVLVTRPGVELSVVSPSDAGI